MQQQVITVWKDGTWKVWGAMDTFYAQSDPDYLTTITLDEIDTAAKEDTAPCSP
jgi:hypothetical protein